MTRIVLTQPQGILGVPGAVVAGIIVPSISDAPANIVVVDTFEGQTVKWIYTLTDSIDNKAITGEVTAIKENPTSVSFNRYSLVGSKLKHTIDVLGTASTLSLEVTNLHVNDLTVSVLRIQAAL